MKTMRKAFLAASVLAALTVSASAQTVDPNEVEASFNGHIDVLAASRAGVPFLPTAGNPFDPRTDVPIQVAAYGYIQAGALFENESLFTAGALARNARFTFSATNLVLDPDPSSRSFSQSAGPGGAQNFQAQYIGGAFEVFFDPDGDTLPGDLQNFSEGSQESFRDGTRILFADITFLQSNYTIPNTATQPSTGLLDGRITFDPSRGDPTHPINQFLAANPNFLNGVLPSVGFSTANRPVGSFSEFSTNGQLDLLNTPQAVIPEPTTMALFGAGLLPLGAFLRRRRGA